MNSFVPITNFHSNLVSFQKPELTIILSLYGRMVAAGEWPGQVKAMQDAEWEIASHGLKWIEHKDMPPEVEKAQIQEAINATK